MELQDMKLFKAVADTGSFLTASHTLNYAQSGISARVKRMEEELGVQLFYRSNRGIRLTKKGELLLSQVNRILDLTDKAVAMISEEDSASGTLRIGSLQTVSETSLPSLLADYHRQFPDVELFITTGTTAALTEAVVSRKLDFAIIGETVSHPDLTSVPYAEETAKIAYSTGDSDIRSITDIATRTLLVFPYGCSYRKLLERFLSDREITPAHIMELTSVGSIIAGVAAGMGISLLPVSILSRYTDGNSVTTWDLPAKYSHVVLTVIHRKDLVMTKAATEFYSIAAKNN